MGFSSFSQDLDDDFDVICARPSIGCVYTLSFYLVRMLIDWGHCYAPLHAIEKSPVEHGMPRTLSCGMAVSMRLAPLDIGSLIEYEVIAIRGAITMLYIQKPVSTWPVWDCSIWRLRSFKDS